MSAEAARLELRVAKITHPAPRIRVFELVSASGGELPAFTAGAHIDIDIPEIEGRSYSLLNSPAETDRYRIAVLREAAGRGGSAWMHEHVAEGDILTGSGPTNHFPLSAQAESHLLIAGGIGITPIMAMAARLAADGAAFHLHYCARSREEAAFADDLAARLGERMSLHLDGGDPARGLDIAALLRAKPPGGHAYVCGPRGMIQAVREATTHWPAGTVHWEAFAGSDADTAPRSNDSAFELELAKSGQILTVPAGTTILEVLRGAGIKVKTLCRDGVCGTCKTRYLAGDVEHRDEVLTKAEQAKFLQVCVSRARPSGGRLVLDL
jgi:vanillate monooxygenase ferredoxin subunit